MAPSYRLCRCGFRYERRKRKCPSCGKATVKRRVAKHAQTLRDDTYEDYLEIAKIIHDVADESCNVCRKPRSKERRHDRDHDHKTGQPRGIACHLCNRSMPHWLDAHRAQLLADYLRRVEEHYNTKPEGQWESKKQTASRPNS